MAKGNSAAPEGADLLGEGRLVVNVDTGKPQGFFQGIVPLESTRLDACLEAYFRQSEQLPTRLILKATEQRIAGLLLQVLPGQTIDVDVFEAAAAAARTISTRRPHRRRCARALAEGLRSSRYQAVPAAARAA